MSFRHSADTDRVNEWRASFEQASQLLFDATGGVHQFGRITVAEDYAASHEADAWLLEENGQSSSPRLGLGQADAHMTLYGDERFKPFVIVRHFAEYAYDLRDEWIGPGAVPAECIDDESSDACIMQATWADGDRFGERATGGPLVTGRVRRFCTSENHDPDHNTLQHSLHGQSCWETMLAGFPELGGSPSAFTGIDWVTGTTAQHFVVAIDRSGSMREDGKFDEARNGVHWWIDSAKADHHLGIVTFSDDASVDLDMVAMIDASVKSDAHDRVKQLSAGGDTAIGDGLRASLETVTAPGPRAPAGVIVLVTDGIHNTGEDPEAVLADIVKAGVRVFTLGVGISVGTALLQHIATATGGTFCRIDSSQPPGKQAKAICDELARISALARNNGALVTAQSAALVEGEQRIERRIEIEEGSDVATFLVNWHNADSPLLLTLHSPDGETISTDTASPHVTGIVGEFPYTAVLVERPVPGVWVAEITGDAATGNPDALVMAFSEHPRIGGFAAVAPGSYQPGDVIPVRVQTYYDGPVTDLRVSGAVRRPDGELAPLRFNDEESAASGDDVARDGVYSALCDETHGTEGTYTFDIAIEATPASTPARGGEPLLDDEHYIARSIPPFRRRLTTAVVVGTEPFEGGPD
ncbi:MAG: VWA domain-containing protein [Solirubrobacteraceae bacterium]|nr:VWA domain-containing protein [Solirubrobacteraceae bacterium]